MGIRKTMTRAFFGNKGQSGSVTNEQLERQRCERELERKQKRKQAQERIQAEERLRFSAHAIIFANTFLLLTGVTAMALPTLITSMIALKIVSKTNDMHLGENADGATFKAFISLSSSALAFSFGSTGMQRFGGTILLVSQFMNET